VRSNAIINDNLDECGDLMKLFSDILTFFKTLSFADIVFFIAILVLMILFVTLIYFILINKDDVEGKDNISDETAEMRIVRELKENMNKDDVIIDFTGYEKDQEDKAIISYDELKKKTSNYELNYKEEQMKDDLSVKKIDLDNLVTKKEEITPQVDVKLFSFAKEEAFLEALKQLQRELG
jgi:hypothetical protein